MKKHGIVIITFLILTMSFISAVSASDAIDLADGDLSADGKACVRLSDGGIHCRRPCPS